MAERSESRYLKDGPHEKAPLLLKEGMRSEAKRGW